MAPKYPAIPDPTNDPNSLRDALLALKQGFEILSGQRGNSGVSAVTSDDLSSQNYQSASDVSTAIADVGPVGQCRFIYVNATTCKLIPFNGNKIKINGALYSIPSTGITVSNSQFGAAANTKIYWYTSVSGGSVVVGAFATGRATDTTAGNVGVEIMSGDPTKTLVGMTYSNASGQFQDDNSNRLVRSWFNDRGVQLFGSSSTTVSTGSLSWVELDAGVRINVLGWAGESFTATFTASGANNGLGNVVYTTPWVDGGLFGLYVFFHEAQAGYYQTVTVSAGSIFGTDTARTLSMAGQVNSGIATWTNKIISGSTLGH
ncbi:hypothetical protein CWO91_16510 [Bradyrhizobium genosp. SA-3]|uniref:hypothetical protein n=1 Tax=Bradyrhizobium genosp. SA-3 TaxID=508868 RepID=UPI0010298E97|nr:hypothetical protein [Bradyrhizobium genosp. SA-3]RZN09630.1 hypothetical protein CWO91_16510 [Bradyrhizobium genosp. SA-3]